MPNCLISRWKDNFPSGNDAYSPKRFKINQEWREENVNLGACLFSVLLVFFFHGLIDDPRASWNFTPTPLFLGTIVGFLFLLKYLAP